MHLMNLAVPPYIVIVCLFRWYEFFRLSNGFIGFETWPKIWLEYNNDIICIPLVICMSLNKASFVTVNCILCACSKSQNVRTPLFVLKSLEADDQETGQ